MSVWLCDNDENNKKIEIKIEIRILITVFFIIEKHIF